MNVAVVDQAATSGTSPLHRASARAKLVALGLVLAAVVASDGVLIPVAIALALAATILAMKIPARAAFILAAYPAFFAALFAVSTASGAAVGFAMVAKASAAGLAAIVVVLTTPYPQVFAPLQAITPPIVGDALLLTYRSVFLLADKFSDLVRAVRLRSGLSRRGFATSARAVSRALGGLLLYSFDLSQRTYDVMRLRGYEGRLRAGALPRSMTAVDAAVVTAGVLTLAASLAWRLHRGW